MKDGKTDIVFKDLQRKHTDKRIYFYLGLINFELNDFKTSIDYYNKYLENDKNSFPGLLNLAIVMQTMGKFADEEGKSATLQQQLMDLKADMTAAVTTVKTSEMKLKHNAEELKKKKSEMKKTESEYGR